MKDLADLLRGTKPKNWVVLAGAGVSIPSGLPAGTLLMTKIIETFSSKRAQKILNDLLSPRKQFSSWLRFEKLNELLQDLRLDEKLDILKRVYTNQQINLNHRVLAHLAAEGALVFTTNFDYLIEKALVDSKCVRPGRMLHYKPNRIRPDSGILPIHGTLRAYTKDAAWGKDKSVSPAVTLRGVGRTANNADWHEIFLNAIRTRHLLIVGYSGSDDFDVVEWLGQRVGRRKTLWIVHKNNASGRFRSGSDLVKKNFRNRKNLKYLPLLRIYNRWCEYDRACKDQFRWTEHDSQEILKNVSRMLLKAPVLTDDPGSIKINGERGVRTAIQEWKNHLRLRSFELALFAGEVLCSLQRYEDGISYLRRALGMTHNMIDGLRTRLSLARAYAEIAHGNSRKVAITHIRKVLLGHKIENVLLRKSLTELDRYVIEAFLVKSRLSLYGNTENIREGFKDLKHYTTQNGDPIRRQLYLERCRLTARSSSEDKDNKKQIINAFHTAYQNARREGDLWVQALASHELGKWKTRWWIGTDLKRNINVLKKASVHLQEAIRLREALGSYREASASANVLAAQQMQICDWIRWSQNAKSYIKRPNLKEARKWCVSAIRNAQYGSSKWDEAQAWRTKILLEFRMVEFPRSEKSFRRAQRLSRKIFDQKERGRSTYMRALMLLREGNIRGGQKVLKKVAKAPFTDALTKSATVCCLALIGAGKESEGEIKKIASELQGYPYHQRRVQELVVAYRSTRRMTISFLLKRAWLFPDYLP